MLSLIITFDNSETIQLQGSSFPRECLVEDDYGDRWYVAGMSGVEKVSPHVWGQASGAGAIALVWVSYDSDEFLYISADQFIEHRVEDRLNATYTISRNFVKTGNHFPFFGEITDAVSQVSGGNDKLVHLHTHSEFSQYDGLSNISELIDQALKDGQSAIAVTDHGTCASHPLLQSTAKDRGIKPIYGMEGYLVDDRFERDKEKRFAYHHLILWAMDDEGLRNLWAISTEAHREGFYQVPRFDWDTLNRLNKGLMSSTACLSGPISYHLNAQKPGADPNKALTNLAKLGEIFDNDRLYVEIHANGLPEQKVVNAKLVTLAERYALPLIAVSDSHYPCAADKQMHSVWYAMKNAKGVEDATENSFAGGADLHPHGTEEMRSILLDSGLPLSAVNSAIENTAKVAERCNADVTSKISAAPRFSKGENATQDDERRLDDLCKSNWERKTIGNGKRFSQDEYKARYDKEMGLLKKKAFCGYFLIVADYVTYAKDSGVLVGPGRGSGGGSLVAYLSDITEVDPVEAELLFERFLTPGRKALPDFDIDFPTSKSDFMADYIRTKYGADRVAQVGTVGRLRNKGAFRDTARFFASRLESGEASDLWRDVDTISKLIDDAEAGTAGLGLSWDELWAQHDVELEPFRQKWPEWVSAASHLVGRVKSYGRHAAGIVISTEGALTDWLPMRMGDDGVMVTQFDMEALELLNLVKFDFLKLRTLDTIQDCVDMVREQLKIDINVYKWPYTYYDDPLVWEELSRGDTLGVFQIETSSGTRLTREFKPNNLNELSDILTLVRPGPMRSGLTRTYMNRRAGLEAISVPDPRLKEVLKRSWGCLLYQEDIMATCMALALYDGEEADKVRKILGKKKVEAVVQEGKKFLAGAIANGMTEQAANDLWIQMAEFAKYSFNRAHAYAYAMISYWTAWLKVNYPAQWLTASMSTVKPDRIPEFIDDARVKGYQVLPPDVNESGKKFKYNMQLAIRYGFLGVKGISDASADPIVEGQPFSNFQDFLDRKTSKVNSGTVNTLARIGAFDGMVSNRRALEAQLGYEASGDSIRCVNKDDSVKGPNDLPCVFDWSSEPAPPVIFGRSGKPLKAKELTIPKKCTIRCRHYTPPAPLNIEIIAPYEVADIMDIEFELLGVYLTHTPFDRVDQEMIKLTKTANELMTNDTPEGEYPIVAVIKSCRNTTTQAGNPMCHITFSTKNGTLDSPIFSESLAKYGAAIKQGNLVAALVKKRRDGRFNTSAAVKL
jgi:DNA polymerase-3 subunit alpha